MGKRRISGSSRVKRATIVLYLGLLLLVACYALMVTTFINRWETRGQFGDSFGALNTIFSGITLVTVVVTLYYQNKANKEGNISKKYELILSRIQELQQIIRVDVILKKVEDDIFNGDIELERLTDLRSDEELDIAEANDGNVGAFDRYIKINHYWFTVLDTTPFSCPLVL